MAGLEYPEEQGAVFSSRQLRCSNAMERREDVSMNERCAGGFLGMMKGCVAGCQLYRTPMGGRGPRLLLELWAEGSESRGAERLLSPLPALALAEPVRLRT